jgi:hypothetical protein
MHQRPIRYRLSLTLTKRYRLVCSSANIRTPSVHHPSSTTRLCVLSECQWAFSNHIQLHCQLSVVYKIQFNGMGWADVLVFTDEIFQWSQTSGKILIADISIVIPQWRVLSYIFLAVNCFRFISQCYALSADNGVVFATCLNIRIYWEAGGWVRSTGETKKEGKWTAKVMKERKTRISD